MLLQQCIEHLSIVYTCITYFVMHWSCNLFGSINVFIQYKKFLTRVIVEYIGSILGVYAYS